MNETLAKYISGLIDSDGAIYFNFVNSTQDGNSNLSLKIQISSSRAVDKNAFVMSLPVISGFGTSSESSNGRSHYMIWTVTSKRDLEMISPRLIKHMVVKGKHLQRMLDMWRENRGKPLSEGQCNWLRAFSKESRADSGPLKVKNHPSWAWLAGYLDGNGSFRSARCKSGFYNGEQQYRQQSSVHASCHINDSAVLEFIQKSHGGYVRGHSKSDNCMVWERNLSKNNRSFALRFLPNVVKHSRIKKHKIEQIISFHNGQQRLNSQAPKGEVIV